MEPTPPYTNVISLERGWSCDLKGPCILSDSNQAFSFFPFFGQETVK